MSGEVAKIVLGMVLATIMGEKEKIWALYEKYQKATRLHISVREYLEWRRKSVC